MNMHLGKEVQDYVYLSAFEYQQDDFIHFKANDVTSQDSAKRFFDTNYKNKFDEMVLSKFNI